MTISREVRLITSIFGPCCPTCERYDCQHDPGEFWQRLELWSDTVEDPRLRTTLKRRLAGHRGAIAKLAKAK